MNINMHTETRALIVYVIRWLLLCAALALLAGSASALFLFLLDWATQTRSTLPWLIWLLPLAGFFVSWVYLRFGREVEPGNNLLIDQIHSPTKIIPLRMAPLVLSGTIISHIFGASVGREGTAVQMGGALADQLSHRFHLPPEQRRILLMAGISAGFGSIFGTPLAGALFGLEVLAIGRLRYDALLPCLMAGLLADMVCKSWGVEHVHYSMAVIPLLTLGGVAAMLVAGVIFGLTGRVFAVSTHALGSWLKRRIPYSPLRAMLVGIVVALCVVGFGAQRYIGLGIPVIQQAFLTPVPGYDFLLKMFYTVVSLAGGFKGGEVTPLFFIGATLGNALSPLLHLPAPLLAGVGLVAVFSGAANTPLASTVMAMELFGAEAGMWAALGCVASYLVSGHSGIYRAQLIGEPKHMTYQDQPPQTERPASE